MTATPLPLFFVSNKRETGISWDDMISDWGMCMDLSLEIKFEKLVYF